MTTTINDIINNARTINNKTQEERDNMAQWWSMLGMTWDRYHDVLNNAVGTREHELSPLYGSEIAHEMTGSAWINLHCDVALWDKEVLLDELRDLYKQALYLQRQAVTDKQKDAIAKLTTILISRGKGLNEDIDKYCSTSMVDDDNDELTREPSKWERSRIMMEYIQENVNKWGAREALKYSKLVENRNKLDKSSSTHMVFPFYVASMIMLKAKLAEEGYGKIQWQAKQHLAKLIELYDHWDVEAKLTQEHTWTFDEDMDSLEEMGEGVCFSPYANANSWAAIIDYKNQVIDEATRSDLSPEEILIRNEESEINWL